MVMNEQQRLKAGTAFISHAVDLWPAGCAEATPEWIRSNVETIISVLEQALRHDGNDACRLPRRLHWLLWLLDDLECR